MSDRDLIAIEKDDRFPAAAAAAMPGEADGGAGDRLAESPAFDVCWSVKFFKVCVTSASSTEIVLDLYVADIKLGTVTLTAGRPCVKIDEEIGGTVRVTAEVCADFEKREVRAKGKACVSGICVRFDHKIFSW